MRGFELENMPVQVRLENPAATAAPLRSKIEELTICLLEFIRYTFRQMEKPFRVITYLLLLSVTNGAVDFFVDGWMDGWSVGW